MQIDYNQVNHRSQSLANFYVKFISFNAINRDSDYIESCSDILDYIYMVVI